MADWILAGLGGLILLGYIVITLEFFIGNRSIVKLSEVALLEPAAYFNLPAVSVIIPARNEARDIRQALTSVLALDYPDFEVIVLNDRSEDETGNILDDLAQTYPQLKVVHIQELPDGWLGKNHALWLGARASRGEFLLFTDADIVFEPSALRRAVHFAETRKLDHLASMPGVISDSVSLSLFQGAFGIFFSLYARPWNAKKPRSGNFIGIGAFNLIRKPVYEAVGTHQAIALRPDDDMKLGKLIKRQGFRQDLCNGAEMLQVEWYASLGEMVEGLMKNAFAGLEYSLFYTLGGVTAQFLFGVWPIIALFLADGLTWWAYLLITLLMQLLCLDHVLLYRLNPLTGLFFPLSTLLMIYVILRATVLTLLHNGIRWRGTYYPLSVLKANRI